VKGQQATLPAGPGSEVHLSRGGTIVRLEALMIKLVERFGHRCLGLGRGGGARRGPSPTAGADGASVEARIARSFWRRPERAETFVHAAAVRVRSRGRAPTIGRARAEAAKGLRSSARPPSGALAASKTRGLAGPGLEVACVIIPGT